MRDLHLAMRGGGLHLGVRLLVSHLRSDVHCCCCRDWGRRLFIKVERVVGSGRRLDGHERIPHTLLGSGARRGRRCAHEAFEQL